MMNTKAIVQNFADQFRVAAFGGLSKKDFVGRLYWALKAKGYDVCGINDLYLEVNGEDFRFIKSVAQGRWIVKYMAE